MATQLETNLNAILNEKTTKIVPSNIKAGVQIFDVTGEYEGTGGSGEAVKGVFEGEEAVLINSIKGAVIEEFAVKGKTTQNGTPAPDTPAEIQNITGNIVVKVTNGTNEQTVTFRLGSQKLMEGGYLADDGIHTYRVQQVLTGNENVGYISTYKYFYIPLSNTSIQWWQDITCNYFATTGETGTGIGFSNSNNTDNAWLFDYDGYFGGNANTFKTFLKDKYNAGNPVIIEYNLGTPTVIPYNIEQQEDWNNLKQLTTYAGTTTITTTNAIKPVLSGEYYIDVPQLPIKIKDMNGVVQINIDNDDNFFDINGNVTQMYNGNTLNGNTVSGNILTSKTDVALSHTAGQKIYIGAGNTAIFTVKMCGVGKTPPSATSTCGFFAMYEENSSSIKVHRYIDYNELNKEVSISYTSTTDYIYVTFGCNASNCTTASYTDIKVQKAYNISLTEEQSIVLTSDVEGEVIKASELTVTPSGEEQIYNELYGKVIVDAIDYESNGTITPQQHTEALTQINDLFGEEASE